MIVLGVVILMGWVAVALLGTQAYFQGEQSKPIHERNWSSISFEKLSKSFTGKEIDYRDRAYAYNGMDAYVSKTLYKG